MSALDRISELQWENDRLREELQGWKKKEQKRIHGDLMATDHTTSLRDQFAMAVIAECYKDASPKDAARMAYKCADAMLEARKGKP